MEEVKQNIMGTMPVNKMMLKLGVPMIFSMILQALYNVVDSIFVANISGIGKLATVALTYAFPIQILMIAIGVGTGVGLNALLSKSLGEKDFDTVNRTAGVGIFLSFCIFIFFLLFGLFGTTWFISIFTTDSQVIDMGSSYLKICCVFSLGSIAYTIYERFLQSTGKTMLSTISQISGAGLNILLDYIFIFPCNWGVAGAAWATIIGQFVSLFVAMAFHYFKNKEIDGNIKFIRPNWKLTKAIYKIGISAALMQALLSVMMACVNAILGLYSGDVTTLTGAFGIYYKIQQIALFACFGLSNTIITTLAYNYGMNDIKRSKECIKFGIIDTLVICVIITVLFEAIAYPLAKLFSLSESSSTGNLISVCETAIRIASIGYIFMGFSVAIQGVLQAFRYAINPLLISLFRLIIFVLPIALLFVKFTNALETVWWTFPIAEFLTAIISYFMLKSAMNKKLNNNETLNKK